MHSNSYLLFLSIEGGLRLLLRLYQHQQKSNNSSSIDETSGQIHASVAIARILITTNPNLLKDDVMSSVFQPLVEILDLTGNIFTVYH